MSKHPSVWAGRWVGALLAVASLGSLAQVGQKPHVGKEATSEDSPTRVPAVPRQPNSSPQGICVAAIAEAVEAEARKVETSNQTFRKREDFRALTPQPRSFFEGKVKELLSQPCGGQDVMLKQYPINIANESKLLNEERSKRAHDWQNYFITQKESSIAMTKLVQCAVQAKAASCGSSGGFPQSAGGGATGPASPTPYAQPAQRPTGTAQQNKELQEALALGRKHQAVVDRVRGGKPKLHRSASVAHACLRPQPGGGVVNDCSYAVEYHYCVFRPTKDSWSEAFDCERSRGGSWQIGPGPNNSSIMHTDGEMVYWFACKYGETLHKPDGISPADLEFQLGRGIMGRCAEWGR